MSFSKAVRASLPIGFVTAILWSGGLAHAGVNIVSSTRSLIIASNNTTTALGNYSKSESFDDTGVYNTNPIAGGDNYQLDSHSTGSQTSDVAPFDLSGTGSVTVGAGFNARTYFPRGTTSLAGSTSYLVDFTVDSPTPFSMTGTLGGLGYYHLGALETIKANFSLAVIGQPSALYSVTDTFSITNAPGPENFSDPIAFATTLQPGNTYELSVASSVSSFRGNIGYIYVPGNSTFDFTATVPEPTSALLALPALLMFRRRKMK